MIMVAGSNDVSRYSAISQEGGDFVHYPSFFNLCISVTVIRVSATARSSFLDPSASRACTSPCMHVASDGEMATLSAI